MQRLLRSLVYRPTLLQSACRAQKNCSVNAWESQMNDETNYWDDLGVKWRAIATDPLVVSRRLERRLRWQGLLMGTAIVCGGGLGILGFFIGLRGVLIGLYRWSLGSTNGWFFTTRGTAALAISIMIMMAVWSLIIGLESKSGSLAEMLDAAIRRATMLLRAIRLGLWVCGILAIFGAGGEVIRDHIYTPSGMPPLGVLAVVVVSALALISTQRIIASSRAKYLYLKSVLVDGNL